MAESNLITPNIPNAVTITVMALVGGVVLTAIRKAIRSRLGASNGDQMDNP